MENNLKGDRSWGGVPSHATDFVSQIVITNIECVKSWWKDKDYLGIRETISNEISISSFPWRWPIVQPYESVNRKLGKPSSFSLGTLSSSVFFPSLMSEKLILWTVFCHQVLNTRRQFFPNLLLLESPALITVRRRKPAGHWVPPRS